MNIELTTSSDISNVNVCPIPNPCLSFSSIVLLLSLFICYQYQCCVFSFVANTNVVSFHLLQMPILCFFASFFANNNVISLSFVSNAIIVSFSFVVDTNVVSFHWFPVPTLRLFQLFVAHLDCSLVLVLHSHPQHCLQWMIVSNNIALLHQYNIPIHIMV